MRVKDILIVLRRDGFFHYEDRKVQAVRPGCGYGVLVVLEPSQIDHDFGVPVWFPSQDELERIEAALKKSDELTHGLLRRGWEGRRPFWKLEDFM